MDNEIWKTHPEYPFIQGNRLGEVRTLDRYVKNGKGMRIVKGHVLKQHRNRDGYLYVQFGVNGKAVSRSVHRLVAECFLENPDNFPEVNHKDNNPLNNSVSNLEWCTREYNIAYREKYGTALNRPVYAFNLKTLEVLQFESQSEAGRELGVYPQDINKVLKGRCKQACGYWFTIADENAIESVRAKFGDIVAHKVEQLIEQQWLHDFINEMQPA